MNLQYAVGSFEIFLCDTKTFVCDKKEVKLISNRVFLSSCTHSEKYLMADKQASTASG